MRSAAHRRGAARCRDRWRGGLPRLWPGRAPAKRAPAFLRRRSADEGVFAVEPGGRRADVPRRVAFAHPRQSHPRPAHPGQAFARRLGRACGRQPVLVRERVGLGLARHGQAGRDQQRARHGGGADAGGGARRRAHRPPGDGPRDAAARAAVRDRPDHRGGAGARAAVRGARLSLFLRHARRGGAYRGGRGELHGVLRARHRGGGARGAARAFTRAREFP